jgi:hypothetical protein
MLKYQTRVKVYVQILKNKRDAEAIVKSSTSARLLVWGGCLQSVATYASLKTLRLFDASQDLPISAVWARGQHCPPRLFGIEMVMRVRLSDRLRLAWKTVQNQYSREFTVEIHLAKPQGMHPCRVLTFSQITFELKIPTIWIGKTVSRSEVFPYAMATGSIYITKRRRFSLGALTSGRSVYDERAYM